MIKKVGLALCLCLVAGSSFAFSWRDLWWRPDQQGQQLMAKGKSMQAAEKFNNKNWRAVAHYRSGNYKSTVETLADGKTSLSHYNRGNALAHMGEYKAAIDAYKKALALAPDDADAKYNKALIEKLLKKQSSSKGKSRKKNKNKKQKQSEKQSNKQDKQKKQDKQSSDQKPQKNKKQAQQQKPKTQKQAEKKAAKQWLSQIPDAPNGLLRQKFLRDYLKQQP